MNLKITHFDLCKATAEKFIRESYVVLYEYQSCATTEFPDVLRFKNGNTWLYEIKVSRQDFKKDCDKDCRVEKKLSYSWDSSYNHFKNICGINWKYWEKSMQEFIVQAPHLGRERFYVCPKDLIQPEEINNGWGLYWYTGKKFYMKKKSKKFKANIYEEMRILEHAFRKYYNGYKDNIIVNEYKK